MDECIDTLRQYLLNVTTHTDQNISSPILRGTYTQPANINPLHWIFVLHSRVTSQDRLTLIMR